MKKENENARKAKIGLLVFLAIILAVIAGAAYLIVSGLFARIWHGTVDSPKKYLTYVADEALSGKNSVFSAMEGLAGLSSDRSMETHVKIKLGEKGEELLEEMSHDDTDLTWMKSLDLNYVVDDGDKVKGMQVGISLNDKKILDSNTVYNANDKVLYVQIPELAKEYLEINLEEYSEEISQYVDIFSRMKEAVPESEDVKKLVSKYVKVIVDEIDDDKIEKTKKAELECEGVSETCTKYSVTLKEKDLKKIIKAVCKQISNDKDLKNIYVKFAKMFDENGEEEYDSLLESLDEYVEEIDEYGIEVTIKLDLYVDGIGNVKGIECEIKPEDESKVVLKMAAAKNKKEMGYELSVKTEDGKVSLAGSGKIKGSKLNGDLVMKVQNQKLFTVEIENYDLNAKANGNLKGTFKIKPSKSVGEIFYSSSFSSDQEYVLSVDVNSKKQSYELGIFDDDEEIVTLSLETKKKKASKVDIPKSTTEINSEDELEEYFADADLDEILNALDKAGVPEEYLDSVAEIDDTARILAFGGWLTYFNPYELTVGTQVIPYLERSRKAKDEQIMSGWFTAAISSYVAEASSLSSNVTYVITITSKDVTIEPSNAKGIYNLGVDFRELSGLGLYGNADGFDFSKEMNSKAGKDINYVTITIDASTGNSSFTVFMKHPEKYYFEEIRNYW